MQFSQLMGILLLTVFTSVASMRAQVLGSCPFGHYLASNSQCMECLTSCSICKDLTSPCQRCAQTQILNNLDKTCHSCRHGELFCGETVICQPHYQLKSGECQPLCLTKNCLLCESIFSQDCRKCDENYTVSKDRKLCIVKGGRNLQIEAEMPKQFNRDRVNEEINGLVNVSVLERHDNLSIELPASIQDGANSLINNQLLTDPTPSTMISADATSTGLPMPASQSFESPQQFSSLSPTDAPGQDTSGATATATATVEMPVQSNLTANEADQNHSLNGASNSSSNTSTNDIITGGSTDLSIDVINNVSTDLSTDIINNVSTDVSNNVINNVSTDIINNVSTDVSNLTSANSTNPAGSQSANTSSQANTSQPTPSTCQAGTILEGSLCTPCDSKCATCINSRCQCLECAQGWLKLGWKCVKNETVKFNFTLQIPPVVAQSTAGQNVTSTNLSTYISQLKASLLTSILPQQYAGQPTSLVTLNSLHLDGRKLILTGCLDRLISMKLTDLQKYINQKLKNVSNLGPLILNHYQLSNSGADQKSQSASAKQPPKETGSVNLAAILVPSIIGFILLILGSLLACYCCKACCFKEQQKTEVGGQDVPELPVSTERYLAKQPEGRELKSYKGEYGGGGQYPSNEVLGDKQQIGSDEQEAGRGVGRKTYDSNNLGDEVVDYANDKGQYRYPGIRY